MTPATTVKQASLFEEPSPPPQLDELALTIASATETSVSHAREQTDRVRSTWDSSLVELMSWGHSK